MRQPSCRLQKYGSSGGFNHGISPTLPEHGHGLSEEVRSM
eukprot:CAMPEP_0184317986 /NCGR_PEP_ID=MMETSP1049-20130417/99896_1 /TAXON_ID=77928 /ORGANISM="Proteomonas sulcata, Strain CCMP704" /LENGTH=39 /DNA_ID= /DNA_START= /DNA_END= /DNA_ORIENTATION=